jgi:hypothetical protein
MHRPVPLVSALPHAWAAVLRQGTQCRARPSNLILSLHPPAAFSFALCVLSLSRLSYSLHSAFPPSISLDLAFRTPFPCLTYLTFAPRSVLSPSRHPYFNPIHSLTHYPLNHLSVPPSARWPSVFDAAVPSCGLLLGTLDAHEPRFRPPIREET